MELPVKQDVKAALLQTNEGFRQLVLEHQALDDQLRAISGFAHLSDQQHFEEVALKKKKLALKDRIEAIIRMGGLSPLAPGQP
jgi:uncharacterized protein YdcH (DUF465 family)